MALKIVTAEERMQTAQERGSVLVLGPYGIGKTSLLYTLDAASTLALDFEGGFKSVQTWKGDSMEVRTFNDAADIACYIGGPNPAFKNTDLFGPAHYEYAAKEYGPIIDLKKYRTIFFDSVSDLSHAAWHYARQTDRATTDKGKFDARGAYGALAENMLTMLRHMQHSRKNIILLAKLDRIEENHRETWVPQIEGGKTARELPGIVDQVVTMSRFNFNPAASPTTGGWIHNVSEGEHRAFVCRTINPWGLPAKERTLGNVEMIEEPHLGKLIEKINAPAKAEANLAFSYSKPTTGEK